jgi:hypothetical protein
MEETVRTDMLLILPDLRIRAQLIRPDEITSLTSGLGYHSEFFHVSRRAKAWCLTREQ